MIENIIVTEEYLENYSQDIIDLYADVGWGKEFDLAILHQKFRNSTLNLFCIQEQQVVGFVRVLSDMVSTTWISEIIVGKKYQGQGIGKHLLNIVTDKFQNTDIYLETFAQSAEFFEKCGLKPRTSMIVCSKKNQNRIDTKEKPPSHL
jgi:ribosomal protein S18 acetylase RimI-like enzyme